MITCPNCQHKELEGTLFCNDCGAQLVESMESFGTQSLQSGSVTSIVSPFNRPPVTSGLKNTNEVMISLHLVDTGQILHLPSHPMVSIGRAVAGQPTAPDIDLSPYQAYGQGVSRFHATLKILNQHIFITDLGSSNGTRVNGQKIAAHIEYPLNHGDVVALGKLKIQFLIWK